MWKEVVVASLRSGS